MVHDAGRCGRHIGRAAIVGVCWLVALVAPGSAAQQSPTAALAEAPAAEASPIDASELRASLEGVKADPSLSDDKRAALVEDYTEALNLLASTADAQQQTATLSAAAESAPQRIAELENGPERRAESLVEMTDEQSSLAEIQAAKRAAEDELAALVSQLQAIRDQQRSRRDEASRLPQRIAELQTTIDTLQSRADLPVGDLDPAVAEAKRLVHRAALADARAQRELAQQKLRTYEAESMLLPLQQDALQRRVSAAERQLEELARQLSNKRQDAVEAEIQRFEQAFEEAPAPLRESASTTLDLLEKWPLLVAQTHDWESTLVGLRSVYTELRSDLGKTRGLVETDLTTGGGLSRSVGYLLQRKRGKLPTDSELATSRRKQHEAVESAQDVLTRTDARLEELPPPALDSDGQLLEPPLLTAEREILQKINRDAERLVLDTLIPLGVQQESYASTVHQYRELIDEHLLWVRSDPAFGVAELRDVVPALKWLLRAEHLQGLAAALIDIARNNPLAVIVYLLAVGLMFAFRPWLARTIVEIGESMAKRPAFQMRPTWEAMFATVMLALPFAVAVGFPGWMLSRENQPDSFLGAAADAIWILAAIILPLEFLRQLVRPCGVALAHFKWPPEAVKPLRGSVQWTMLLILPLMFLWRILYAQSESQPELSALSRLLFTLAMLAVAGVLWRLFHPRLGAAAVLVSADPNGWLAKLRWLWHPLITAIPLGLALLVMFGYGYSATQLAFRLYRTVWMLIVIAVLAGLAFRWLVISHRQIALQQMRERIATRDQQAGVEGGPVETLDENRLDVTTINQQTRRLINAAIFVGILVGLYWIWSPVLPALGFLERVALWDQKGPSGEVIETVTLSNLLLAIPILVLTFVVVRNAPGLLETTLLQRLPLENAVRYAITTLTSYILAGLGLLMAAGTLGLHWSSIQWLVAGLGVGLGFGLQEIFANFISGIILLFEQPIRVGDIVTLDGTTGVISRIRMRATTLTNWDRQEYVVPNKDFITGRLVNWTLSDTTNRVVIEVGIAYGSDTRKACRLLEEVSHNHPDVLNDPAPIITFEGFGDSTLKFVLRFYLATLERRLMVIHEMHTAINDRFREEGIEIAFPQRDLHLRSVPDGLLGSA